MLLKNVSVNGAEENAEAPPLSSPGLPVQHVPVPLLPGSGALSGRSALFFGLWPGQPPSGVLPEVIAFLFLLLIIFPYKLLSGICPVLAVPCSGTDTCIYVRP